MLTTLCWFSTFFCLKGQVDTSVADAPDFIEPADSTIIVGQGEDLLPEVEEKKRRNNEPRDTAASGYQKPGKAALYSAVFPGLGQVYNKKYWKLPIVYAALGAGVYAITFNHDQYQIYLDAFYTRIDGDPDNDQFSGQYDAAQLVELQNIYRRYRDLSIILTTVAYGLQVLDAYVDAHLFYFDVTDDLSFNWQPSVIRNQYSPQSSVGLGITLSFK